MDETESQFVNVAEAMDYINSCPDPVVRDILWTAYSTLIFEMGPTEITGQFDVLFLMRLVSQLFKDRERLLIILSGTVPEK